ncbi:cyclic di-GMP phosphodiesterase response regulator RpfG [Clostridium homopropionicum DSM 5847]|uniref:Cyclic di-GMP phosphodiesterase response regulator RpfG n=1 Tax=Clostridium homopropionicum DSM 5847 TaxID=1121318 RepID=A0A0L6Z767_9CLOT|nr:HD-GYP domain-containing protein [Clostridium homopropionicum]KOA18811.1 cyclic di-GMP phosphodiesterase response regulator RpfG [Clostridium homopropionicum DSM 5847]SFG76514.1 HD-GYP domain, c-di-GMP phosphodiesterase class II (or its inactivated variant) [Clostridium homopropionicum]
MRKISISQITGNEVLGKPIYDISGRLMLAAGTTLKPGFKMRLGQMGILSVYIDDELSKGVEMEDYISEELRNETKQTIKKGFTKFINKQSSSLNEILKKVDSLVDSILSREEVMINICDIKSKDMHLYEHSVSVCALSIIMGVNLGYTEDHLKELAVGSLLHDLGKLITPQDIIDKNREGTLTADDLEIIKTHPLDGYEIMNDRFDISYISKAIILMHHENCDGSGFPLGLTDDKLHETVKLVSICNTFDNLTSDFSGSTKMEVYEALEYLVAMSDTLFDKALVNTFIKNVAAYPSGSIVKLNTGACGIVLKQNKAFPLRPIINLIFDEKGEKLETPIEMDLSQETTVFILGTTNSI